MPKEEVTPQVPHKYPTSLEEASENIAKLVKIIGNGQSGIKEMLLALQLKDRKNFMELFLSPAISQGYVRLLYPDKPRHPRQKYLLTVKGQMLYAEIGQ